MLSTSMVQTISYNPEGTLAVTDVTLVVGAAIVQAAGKLSGMIDCEVFGGIIIIVSDSGELSCGDGDLSIDGCGVGNCCTG